MKKISSILVILIIFNFIFSYFVYADENETIEYSEESFNQLVDEGKVTIDGETEEVSDTKSSTASMVGVQTSMLASGFIAVNTILKVLVNSGGFYYTESDYSASNIGVFTINSLVFGEYLLFNANVNQTNKSLNPDVEPTKISENMDALKENIATYFQFVRLFAIALIIVLLIFTLLRLGVADLAEDRARYKEVIKSWVLGLAFIGLLPYIISIINVIIDNIMDMLWNARLGLENNDYSSFESSLFLETLNGTVDTSGLKSAAYFIEYVAFTIMQFVFFWKYILRSLRIFGLILVAPIIGIIHIFKKIRGQEGIIGNWFSKYLTNMFMQPLHALLYLVFMFMASNIVIKAPLLAVIFLWALSRAEKIFNVILEIDYGKIASIFSK